MGITKLKESDVESVAGALGLKLKPGVSATIASMVSNIRNNVYEKASSLRQDAPLSVFFDAR